MTTFSKTPRPVMPRRSLLTTGAVAFGLLATTGAGAQSGEGGEAGEGAVAAGLPDAAAFLLAVGLFDATMRIVGALYASGETAEAAEQMEFSHHAHYEDFAEGLTARGLDPFEAETQAFGAAVAGNEGADAVAAALDVVLQRTAAVFAAASATDQMQAIEALVRTAALDYEAGVADDGEVLSDHEYRDAWGFVETAEAQLIRLAGDGDTATAEVATRALTALEPTEALFDGLTATRVPAADTTVLHGAAARIEISRLRLG